MAFWSLDTDLQLGYEIYDRSYEINSIIQAISTAASRSSLIQTDTQTSNAYSGLSTIVSQLRSAPVSFFNEISNAASSRANNEGWHISRIRSASTKHVLALNTVLNATGPLSQLDHVTNPSAVSAIRISLLKIAADSKKVLQYAEDVTKTISIIRGNSSLLLTPDLLAGFLNDSEAGQISSALLSIRNSLAVVLLAVRDTGRLIVAQGSIHELLSRSTSRDTSTRTTALNNFVNNYNRVRNNLISSVASYQQAAESSISNFVARVLSNYQDDIVRPKFEKVQLPLVQAFGNVITSKVYNQTFFESSFDEMRNSILALYANATINSFSQSSVYREEILDLQRTSFVRRYSHCLDELVTEAQATSNSITNKYAFCLNERTSGIVVVIPSTSNWLSVVRDNINFILQQLNACLNGQTSVAGRTTTSDCIQFVSKLLIVFAPSSD